MRFMAMFARDVANPMIAYGELKLGVATWMTTFDVDPAVPFGSSRVDMSLVDVVLCVVAVARG